MSVKRYTVSYMVRFKGPVPNSKTGSITKLPCHGGAVLSKAGPFPPIEVHSLTTLSDIEASDLVTYFVNLC